VAEPGCLPRGEEILGVKLLKNDKILRNLEKLPGVAV
jgi:hypothetical protein